MHLNKRTQILVPAAVLIIATLLYLLADPRTSRDTSSGDTVQSYISQNISLLSPVHEQLGGTFYTTDITASAGTGVVHYEDGHNAYIADFAYDLDPYGKLVITSFVLRR